jgi:hypothetical protein
MFLQVLEKSASEGSPRKSRSYSLCKIRCDCSLIHLPGFLRQGSRPPPFDRLFQDEHSLMYSLMSIRIVRDLPSESINKQFHVITIVKFCRAIESRHFGEYFGSSGQRYQRLTAHAHGRYKLGFLVLDPADDKRCAVLCSRAGQRHACTYLMPLVNSGKRGR